MTSRSALLHASLFLALAAALSACGTSDGGADDPNAPQKQGLAQMVAAQTGDNVVYIRNSAGNVGVYQNTTTGEYFAASWEAFTPGEAYSAYVAANHIYQHLTPAEPPAGNPNGIGQVLYVGEGQTFEDAPAQTKDLESYRAAAKAQTVAQLKGRIMSQYGLSESRAGQVATLVNSWAKLSQNNELTSEDTKKLSTAVLGTDLVTFQNAYVKAAQGEKSDLDRVTAVAAKTNGISTEQAAKILAGFAN